ncbi:MAG: ZIP family metal transporter [Caldisericia bacterium]|jgi:zinc and cadmium transporter|nr:ZIP family metal transporter [Caldisericia bacterium]
MILIYILISTIIVSLISLIGIFFINKKIEYLEKTSFYLVSFSTGALLTGAILHLIPESLNENTNSIYSIVFGIFLFFILETFLKWRHCHEFGCEEHTFIPINLLGDSLHNFIDGVIISSSYLVNFKLGIISTLNIIFHEVPQELGDYGVLIFGGLTPKRALKLNFIVALTSILGGVFGFYLLEKFEDLIPYVIGLTAGNFLYLSLTDLIPELHKKVSIKNNIEKTVFILIGILIMILFKIFFE